MPLVLVFLFWSTGQTGSAARLFVMAAVVAALAFAVLLAVHYLLAVGTLELYEDGFVMRNGGNTEAYLWSEIRNYLHAITRIDTSIYYYGLIRFSRRSTLRYHLAWQTVDGKQFVVNRVGYRSDIVQLAEILPKLTTAPLAATLARELKNGNSIACGEIILTPQGIKRGTQSVNWKDVVKAELKQQKLGTSATVARMNVPQTSERSTLTIWTGGAQAGVFTVLLVDKTPNVFALAELVHGFAQQQTA
jgi:hypothetical protein